MAAVANTAIDRFTNVIEFTGGTMTAVDDWMEVLMAIQTVNGGCVHIEIDAEDGLTHATFVFKSPQNPEILGGFVSMLAQGIEVLVPITDPDDEEEDDD
jgi:hypothetical protein